MCCVLVVTAFFCGSAFAQSQSTGRLVKASSDAVYFLHSDGRRYVFPNERVYRSWFESFDRVELLSDAALAALPIGGNVTYRPTSRMVKIETDPKVYAVGRGGVLRWVSSEETARSIYGPNWATFVDDVSDVLFTNYQIGTPIFSANDYQKEAEALPFEKVGEDIVRRAIARSFPQTPASSTLAPSLAPDTMSIQAIHDGLFPGQVVTTTDWRVEVSPAIAPQEATVKMTVRPERPNGKSISRLTLSLAQQTTRDNRGKAESLIFFNDGTHGDLMANDEYFTATTPAGEWYRDVGFGSLVVSYSDGSVSETRLVGIAFTVFDYPSSQMRAVETPSYIGFAPVFALQAAQAYARTQVLCSARLQSQIGYYGVHLPKTYYLFRSGLGYLETGGFLNTVYATDRFYASVNPSNPEWNTCDPITSHELTHTLYYRIPKPVWADEGLAEYTSQAMSGSTFICDDHGWKRNTESALRPYVSIRPDDWVYDEDHYATGVCVFQNIERVYGSGAVSAIYRNMQNKRHFEVGEGGGHCAPGFNFYRDVLEASAGPSVRQLLQSKFSLDVHSMECADAGT